MTRTRNRKPTHPGKVFRVDVLEPLNMKIPTAADHLGVSRKHLSLFINEHIGCTKDLANRLAHATNTSMESWLNMQTAIDVWEATHEAEEDRYASIRPFTESVA